MMASSSAFDLPASGLLKSKDQPDASSFLVLAFVMNYEFNFDLSKPPVLFLALDAFDGFFMAANLALCSSRCFLASSARFWARVPFTVVASFEKFSRF